MEKIKLGHSAYTGSNSMSLHDNYSSALSELLSRRFSMESAHKALQRAKHGEYCCASFKGRLCEVQTVII